MHDIRIAVVISYSPVGKIQHNLECVNKWVIKAAEKGASIICFPEMNITGYTTNEEIRRFAENIPGSISNQLVDLAVKKNIIILGGMAEKDEKGLIYASHIIAYPNKDFKVYRKLHIAPPEQAVLTKGDDIPLFETKQVRFGIQLCYDAHFPELSSQMALQGAEVIFIPHASPRGTPVEKYNSWIRHLVARAYDNSIFIVACNQTGKNKNGMQFPGVAIIIGPSGEIIKKDTSGIESIIIVDLKADAFNKVRNHKMRFFLPNRRADLY